MFVTLMIEWSNINGFLIINWKQTTIYFKSIVIRIINKNITNVHEMHIIKTIYKVSKS